MADFASFSAQGPVVPINLFSQNAAAGTSIGNSVPTGVTAAIQGGFKGIEAGQQITENFQQEQIRQNQIDQQPVENKIREAQATIQTLSAERAVALQADTIQAQAAELEDEALKYQTDKQNREQENAFVTTFQKASSQEKAQMVLGGQFSSIFANNGKLEEQALQTVYLDPNNGLTTNVRNSIGGALKIRGLQSGYGAAAKKEYPAYVEAESNLFNDPLTGNVINNTGLSASQLYNNASFIDSGLYKTGSDGKTVLTDVRTGLPQQTAPLNRGGVAPAAWDMVYKDPQTGQLQVVAKGVDKTPKEKFDKWFAKKALQDGSSLRSDIRNVQNEVAKQNSPQKNDTTEAAILQEQAGTSQRSKPLRISIAENTLNLSSEQVAKLDPTLKELEASIMKERNDPTFRGSAAAITQRGTFIDTIAKSVAYTQYDSSPELQAQYTPEKVIASNEAIRLDAERKLAFAGGATTDRVNRAIAPFLASDPKDLYYRKNSAAFKQNAQFLVNSYTQIANARAAAAANRQTTSQRLMQQLAGARNGRQ